MMISQTRDNVGVIFGKKWKRAGGNALSFYSSQVVLFDEKEKVASKVIGEERIHSVDVKAGLEKNKVYDPFRKCRFPILNQYGMDDVMASLQWLKKTERKKRLVSLGVLKSGQKVSALKHGDMFSIARRVDKKKDVGFKQELSFMVKDVWNRIDRKIRAETGKYG
jgi:RecA/RadA recombinase